MFWKHPLSAALLESVRFQVKIRENKLKELPSGGSVFMRLDYNHFDADGCAQQVNHLLMGESSDSHLADLHKPAALPQSCLPGEAKGLHIGHDALEVDVETKLAEAVPSQSHLWCLATSGRYLETESNSF